MLWQLPGIATAADATGWDCIKAQDGAWRCNPGQIEPTPVVPKPAARLPLGPVTPPASSLPPPPPAPEAVKVAPAAKPAPAKPEAIAEPAKQVEPRPAPATVKAAPAPTKQPKPATATQTPVVIPSTAPVRKTERPSPVKQAPGTVTRVIRKPASSKTAKAVGGEGPWALCPPQARPEKIAYNGDRSQAEIKLSADEAELSKKGVSSFKGNVIIQRADQRLNAEQVNYDRDKELVTAKGNVSLLDNDISISSDDIRVDLKSDQSAVNNASFNLFDKHGRGEAKQLFRDGKKNVTRLDNSSYTTCPAGKDDWAFKADKIELDHDEGVGTAESVSVNFMGIPFFYAPALTFPIDNRRKSGLLTPSFGNDDESGTEIALPYYWNIAPNRDATITPRILSKRGLQLGAEYRYLGDTSEGKLTAEYLASDNEYNDEDRSLFAYRNTSTFSPHLTASANINYVSDDEYFEDLGRNISLSSTTHLERRIDVRYATDSWDFTGRLEGYQTLDDTVNQRPYQRLPQFVFNAHYPDQHFGLQYDVQAEAVFFDRRDGATGNRLDIQPSVSLPLMNSYGYITPKLGLRYTKYNLDDTLTGSDDSPDRSVSIFSIDSGLFFDRDTEIGGRAITQTLEPRLYYLNIPERNQDDLIVDEASNQAVFDTSLFDFSFDQLFRENRFTGADRVGDANQLTAALTTRFIDNASGLERASASIGQIFYFDDREVTLPGGVVETDSSSDIVAEVSARFTKELSARAGIQWNPHESETDKGNVSLRYQSDAKSIVNFGYRYRRDLLEQTDIGFSWPINNQWSAVGRWNYALDENTTIDAFAGLEYESCCWIVRVVGRDYINDLGDDDRNFALLLQLELKGLTSFGDNVKKFVGRGILGYDRDPLSDDLF